MKKVFLFPSRPKWPSAVLLIFLIGVVRPTVAGTVVLIESAIGNFKVELYDEQAPNTVANFLNYVESGLYHFTMVDHAGGTFITGGSFGYNSCSTGPEPIATNPPIAVENTGFANEPFTIAMVRDTEDPNTVRNRWLINLGDNSALGTPDTRPVVFGKVIDGETIALDISVLWRVPMNIGPSVPTLNYDGNIVVNCGFFNRDNVVLLAYSVEGQAPEPESHPVSFDESSGLLIVKVDVGEPTFYQISFSVVSTSPEVVIQALPNTVLTLPESVDKIATFDGVSGELYIPELAVGDTVAFTDVRFVLTDSVNLLFTLQSFSQ